MIDAKATRDISEVRHQELVNEDIITLTQEVEMKISEAANAGNYSVIVNIEDYYRSAVHEVKEKLISFCYNVSIECLLGIETTMTISW